MQRDYDKQLKELQQKLFFLLMSNAENLVRYERKLAKARDDLEIRRKSEIFEIEGISFYPVFFTHAERKNMHINELMQKHEKGFQEIKAYYNDILNTNVELIRSLKAGFIQQRAY